MMKKILPYIVLALSAGLLLTACFKDDRNNYMVDDSLSLSAQKTLQQASVHIGSIQVGIAKAGKGSAAATIRLSAEESDYISALKLYNAENGSAFEALPSQLYSFDQTSLHFSEKDIVKTVTVSWDPKTVADYIGESESYVIPMRLLSDDLEVNGEKSFEMIQLVRTTVSVRQESMPFTVSQTDFETEDDRTPVTEFSMKFDLVSSHALPGIDLRFPVQIDNALAEAFSAGEEEDYVAAPEGLVTILTPEVGLAAGKTDAQFEVLFDKKKLLDESGKLPEFPNYVVPVRVVTEQMNARQGEKDFSVEGLGLGNSVVYITIKYASDGISSVNRVWGLYSQGSAWYSGLDGFTGGADRTLAMDDEYVYVARSSAAGGVYALSLSSGAFVKNLDIADAASKGCTFATSCVRMIPSDNGRGILSFCTLKGDSNQHLYVYAYTAGVDAAPTLLLDFLIDNKPANTPDWRRYGDRYTVQGTWEDGMLWFQTWSDGAAGKTLGFKLSGGVITNPSDPVDYYIPGAKAGIRDVVWYPGCKSVLITHPEEAAFYTPGEPNPGMNQWQPYSLLETAPDFALSYGYNFFSFHGTNFMAYSQLDEPNGASGRLVIIEDTCEKPADFPAVLKAQKNRMDFPIQDAEDFEARASVAASSSVMDCTVREINGNTYIAVLLNGGGLSLFQLQ